MSSAGLCPPPLLDGGAEGMPGRTSGLRPTGCYDQVYSAPVGAWGVPGDEPGVLPYFYIMDMPGGASLAGNVSSNTRS